MRDVSLISSAEAARRLGVHPSRMRALADRGELGARKLANRWFFLRDAVERRADDKRPGGRPYDPGNAWALLLRHSGERSAPVSKSIDRRLEARSRKPLGLLLPRLRRRAEVRYYFGPEFAVQELVRRPDFVASGASASRAYAIDIKAPGVIDGYMPKRKAEEVAYRYALQQSSERQANVVLRAIDGYWPLAGRSVAPIAAVAADLVESVDQRSQRAGRQLMRRLPS